MFIAKVLSKGKKGQSYTSVLLRESFRVGTKVKSRTLAVLTALPPWLLAVIERAVSLGRDPASCPSPAPSQDCPAQAPGASEALLALASDESSPLALRSGLSFGALFVVHEVARQLFIPQALGHSWPAKLALWQVLARALSPATSLLAMVRLAGTCAASALLKLKASESFTEDDLYQNGGWLDAQQPRIETALWNSQPKNASRSLFFYDVTSSYFEGQQNLLAAFGYNRDNKKGKKQVVMGLLTDETGEPVSVSLFAGNTNDLKTFPEQISRLKNTFGCPHITLVGDRGMIRGPQQGLCRQEGVHYISALHKAEIKTLLQAGILQMEFFDQSLHETLLPDARRLIVRRNPVRQEEMARTRQGFLGSMETWLQKANAYLQAHPRAKVITRIKSGQERLKLGGLAQWIQLKAKGRVLHLSQDAKALAEASKLDGCYAVVTDVPAQVADTDTVHQRYKDLANVERDFRTLKQGHLELRPWYVQREDNTRAHALTAMLALKIRRRLEAAWQSLNITVEEGLRLLEQLCIMDLYDKSTGRTALQTLPQPNDLQGRLLGALNIPWSDQAPKPGPPVVTRVKLEDRRKSAINP